MTTLRKPELGVIAPYCANEETGWELHSMRSRVPTVTVIALFVVFIGVDFPGFCRQPSGLI
jgi:hypothetical protein